MKINTRHKSWIRIPIIIGAAILLYVALFIFGNRSFRQIEIERLSAAPTQSLDNRALTVTSWNLGYGGLGAESDFVADGGTHFLPPSRDIVNKNIDGIVGELKNNQSDIVLIQEIARPSFITRGGDTLGTVNKTLTERDNAFSADFTIRFALPPYNPQHGLFTSTRIVNASREVVPLPLEPGYIMGVSRRLYHLQIVRLPFAGGEWSVINVHLSAFDDGANIRAEQLRTVLDLANREYEKGNFVIIGGDWNLEFARPGRPTTTKEKDLFWIHPFPTQELRDGWKIAVDETTPSVRTNERPYIKNENFTTVIDGFIVSPNVRIETTQTTDLDFQHTDHHPVTATFQAIAP